MHERGHHRPPVLRASVLAGLMLLVACGEQPDRQTSPSAEPTTAQEPEDPEPAYSCFGPAYPESVWADQEPAGDVEHPGREVLLAEFGELGTPGDEQLDGWFLLEAGEDRLAVAREREVHLEPGDDMLRTHDVVAVADFGSDGQWHLQQWSGCTPQLVQNSLGAASVWRDGEPDPSASSVDLLVVEMACASGRSAEGRVDVAHLDEGDEAVSVAIGVEPLDGDQACPGNPATPVTIELAEPLGDRPLIDASVYPPRPLEDPPDNLYRLDDDS